MSADLVMLPDDHSKIEYPCFAGNMLQCSSISVYIDLWRHSMIGIQ